MLSRKITSLFMPLMAVCIYFAAFQSAHAELELTGVDKELEANIRAYLQIDDEPCDAADWRVKRLFSVAEAEIRTALEVRGYYAAKINKSLEKAEACWVARFDVQPGEPVRLRDVVIAVDAGEAGDIAFEKVIKNCRMRADNIFVHSSYERCKRSISRLAEDRGYFSGEFTQQRVDVYPELLAADVALEFVSGPRYAFGDVDFNQQVLDAIMVERFVEIEPGEPYDAERLRRLQRDLAASGYFDQVNLTTSPREAPFNDVPVQISLTPGLSKQYSAGVGFATDLGPKLRLGYLNRRRNEKGHQLELETNLSPVRSNVSATYRVPLKRPNREWIAFDTGYKVEDTDDFSSKLFSVGTNLFRKRFDDWAQTLFLDLRLEDYTAGEAEKERSKLLTPGISYSYVAEDYPPRPLAGHRSLGYLRGAADGFVSDTSFLQFYAQTKRVLGLWSGGRIILRGEYGTTLIDELDSLPSSVRFYAGGDVSVRGYDYKSLGPRDSTGAVVGGKHLVTGSLEIEQQVSGPWSAAVFVDTGNAFDDYADINVATGVGAGIRWFSPLGPIRLDVAVPLANDAPDNFRIHVTLGPDL
jgi:translocation and assembly module TamA